MSKFLNELNALYEKFPAESDDYESDFRDLAAELAEKTEECRLLKRELADCTDACNVWRRENATLKRELADPTDPESKAWQFQEVMAAMHGDGGHYLAKHGPVKAAGDAIYKWYSLKQELAEALELLKRAYPFPHCTIGCDVCAQVSKDIDAFLKTSKL